MPSCVSCGFHEKDDEGWCLVHGMSKPARTFCSLNCAYAYLKAGPGRVAPNYALDAYNPYCARNAKASRTRKAWLGGRGMAYA